MIYSPFANPNLSVTAQGECFWVWDKEEMHIQIICLQRQQRITTYQSLIPVTGDTSGHYTLQQANLRPVLVRLAHCYSLLPAYAKLSNAWTEIAQCLLLLHLNQTFEYLSSDILWFTKQSAFLVCYSSTQHNAKQLTICFLKMDCAANSILTI